MKDNRKEFFFFEKKTAMRCFLGPIQLRAPSLLVDSYVERAQSTSDSDSDAVDSGGVVQGLLLNNTVCASLMALPLLSLARFVVAPRRYEPHAQLTELVTQWRLMRAGAVGLSQDDALLLVDIFKV